MFASVWCYHKTLLHYENPTCFPALHSLPLYHSSSLGHFSFELPHTPTLLSSSPVHPSYRVCRASFHPTRPPFLLLSLLSLFLSVFETLLRAKTSTALLLISASAAVVKLFHFIANITPTLHQCPPPASLPRQPSSTKSQPTTAAKHLEFLPSFSLAET